MLLRLPLHPSGRRLSDRSSRVLPCTICYFPSLRGAPKRKKNRRQPFWRLPATLELSEFMKQAIKLHFEAYLLDLLLLRSWKDILALRILTRMRCESGISGMQALPNGIGNTATLKRYSREALINGAPLPHRSAEIFGVAGGGGGFF